MPYQLGEEGIINRIEFLLVELKVQSINVAVTILKLVLYRLVHKYKMQNLFFQLNLDNIQPLLEPYDEVASHYRIPVRLLNPKLTELFLSRGIAINYAECFRRFPGQHSAIHADFNVDGELVKVNWIYGGKNSKMIWYDPKPNITGEKDITEADTNYTRYEYDDVSHIATLETKPTIPYLLQAGTPHRVVNHIETRICISCVLYDLEYNHLTMEQAKILLADLII